jgi:hypothetical protein
MYCCLCKDFYFLFLLCALSSSDMHRLGTLGARRSFELPSSPSGQVHVRRVLVANTVHTDLTELA